MKGRALLLAARDDGAQAAALLQDGRLQDLLLSPAEDALGAEAVFLGRVERLLPAAEKGRGAAFLDLGGATGYLAEAKGLREGDRLLVEIRAYPGGAKAWPVTRRVTLRSRRLALTPGAPGLNLSRAIKGEKIRADVKTALERALGGVEGIGCVARSVCAMDPQGLEEEAGALLAAWRALGDAGAEVGLRRARTGAVGLALREWSAQGRIRTQGAAAEAALATLAPEDPLRARIAAGEEALFDQFDVWAQAAAAQAGVEKLPSGGALRVEATAALIAADVDSGQGAAAAADAEAAAALPRLLRLGGHGGLIGADFIAAAPAQRKAVEAALQRALKGDAVETEILGWTAGGLLEMRRKRARSRLTREDLAAWVGG